MIDATQALPAWPVSEAKSRFCHLLERLQLDGPHLITRNGKEVAVLASAKDWRLTPRGAYVSLHPPDVEMGLDDAMVEALFARDATPAALPAFDDAAPLPPSRSLEHAR